MGRHAELFDIEDRLRELSAKGDDLERINALVDFEAFRSELERAVPRSDPARGDRPPYDPVLMFRILILQARHSLSDERTEYLVKDRLSFMRFLGLTLADQVPDANSIGIFREALTRATLDGAPAIEGLFRRFDAQLRAAGFTAMGGQIVDATVASIPKPHSTEDAMQTLRQDRLPDDWAHRPAELRPKDRDARGTQGKAKPAPRIPNKPSMPPEAVARLTEAIHAAACYLEYGSGGSTVLATSLGIGTLITVESDKDWLQMMRQRLKLPADTDTRFLLHADIGPTKSFGHPASTSAWAKFHTYPMAPWDLARARGLAPDLVLVDGRFRAACFLATLLFARPGTVILFDDYAERAFYHTVEAFGRPVAMVGRMAEFRVPESLAGGSERDRAWEALYRAVADPR